MSNCSLIVASVRRACVEMKDKIVKSPADAPVDSEIKIRLAEGELRGRVL